MRSGRRRLPISLAIVAAVVVIIVADRIRVLAGARGRAGGRRRVLRPLQRAVLLGSRLPVVALGLQHRDPGAGVHERSHGRGGAVGARRLSRWPRSSTPICARSAGGRRTAATCPAGSRSLLRRCWSCWGRSRVQVAWFLWWWGASITWVLPDFKWAFKYDLDLVQMTAVGAAALLAPIVSYLIGRYHPKVRAGRADRLGSPLQDIRRGNRAGLTRLIRSVEDTDLWQLSRTCREFIALLESKGQLKRISAPVDPNLEIGEMTDRVSKQVGPALLFENPVNRETGERYAAPVAINLMGSYDRMAWALGVDAETGTWKDLDAVAKRVTDLAAARHAGEHEGQVRHPGQPEGPRDVRRQGDQEGPVPGGRAARRRGRPHQAAGAHDVAGGRRSVRHAAARGDEQPEGQAERRHVPAAGLRQEHDRSAHPRAPRRRQEPAGVARVRRRHGSRCQWRLAPTRSRSSRRRHRFRR